MFWKLLKHEIYLKHLAYSKHLIIIIIIIIITLAHKEKRHAWDTSSDGERAKKTWWAEEGQETLPLSHTRCPRNEASVQVLKSSSALLSHLSTASVGTFSSEFVLLNIQLSS